MLPQVSGFLEESTRFMNSKAGEEGASYRDVLREALDGGYAEGELVLRLWVGVGVGVGFYR